MDWQPVVRHAFALRHRQVDDDVVEELAQHAETAFAAARADGESVEQADASVRALIEAWSAGTSGPVRVQRAPLLDSAPATSSVFAGVGLDIRHGVRVLIRQPGFAFASIVLIALGVGVTAAIFSVINGVLLRPFSWTNAHELVSMAETRDGGTVNTTAVFTNAAYLAWKESGTTLQAIGAYGTTSAAIESADGAERVPAATVTASLFPLLGVSPMIGPGIQEADEEKSVVVLSYAYWRDRLGSDPAVIGKTVRFASGARTVVGVMPASFEFVERDVQLWLPFHVVRAIVPGSSDRTVSMFSAIARLKPGVTPHQAADEAQRLARAVPDLGPVIPAVFGAGGPAVIRAVPIADALVGDVRDALWLLLAGVLLLWMAATGNVASMQLAHTAARQREVAIRAAIGAGTGRLTRQLLVENAVLAVCGGLAGIVLTMVLLRAMPGLLPADFPRVDHIAIDWRVLGVALLLTAGASAAIALLPARMAATLDVKSALIDGAAGASNRSAGFSPLRSRGIIITAQVAIATVLLIGAALLGRSFMKQRTIDRGFDAANVLTARVRLPASITTPAARQTALEQIMGQVSRRPGVKTVGVSDSIPLGGSERRFASTIAEPGREPVTVSALMRVVSPDYFDAMGLRRVGGRAFSLQDTAESEPVVVVNQTFAKKYLGASPVDAVLPAVINNDEQRKWRVAGVIADAMRAGVNDPVQPEVFVAGPQFKTGYDSSVFITIRMAGDPVTLTPDLRGIVHAVDRRATLEQVMTMDARILKSLSRARLYAVLFGGFAGFAALIAIIGLFAGLSYGVAQRTREICVRTALGATPGNILRLIIGQGLTITAAGLVIGIGAAAYGARLLSTLLYGVTSHDVASYVVVTTLLLVVALAACAIPARRAAKIEPAIGIKNS